MPEKIICTGCGKTKDLTKEFFSPRKLSANGFNRQCRTCKNLEAKAYQKKSKNAKNRYRNMTPDNKKSYIVKVRKWQDK